MHESSALPHQLQTFLETQRIRRRQRRGLPERKSRRRFELETWNPFFQQLKRDPAHQINPGLRIFGPGQLRLRPVETNARQIVA